MSLSLSGKLRPGPRWSAPTRLARRTVVTLVGVGLLVIGVVLLIAPGPGLLVVALALLVLGAEYDWARRRYEDIRARAEVIADKAVSRPGSFAASTAGGLAMIAAGIVLIIIEELPGSGVASGLTLAGGGAIVLATLAYAAVRGVRSSDS